MVSSVRHQHRTGMQRNKCSGVMLQRRTCSRAGLGSNSNPNSSEHSTQKPAQGCEPRQLNRRQVADARMHARTHAHTHTSYWCQRNSCYVNQRALANITKTTSTVTIKALDVSIYIRHQTDTMAKDTYQSWKGVQTQIYDHKQ
jgi:hypothetical protein